MATYRVPGSCRHSDGGASIGSIEPPAINRANESGRGFVEPTQGQDLERRGPGADPRCGRPSADKSAPPLQKMTPPPPAATLGGREEDRARREQGTRSMERTFPKRSLGAGP